MKEQIDYIVSRGLAGHRGRTWEASVHMFPPEHNPNDTWTFKCRLDFRKIKGDVATVVEEKQWRDIKNMIVQTGKRGQFKQNSWTNIEDSNSKGSSILNNLSNTATSAISQVNQIISPINAPTWQQLVVPPELLGDDSDIHLANHPAWNKLYGVAPQIRILLSNIKRAQETNGESRNHAVLFGHSGCGKTTTLRSLEQMFGENSVLKLDATSTTRAGLEKLFFNQLTDIPPLVFMEEAEKADPEALKIWLGALDDRGEIRKVNFRVNQIRALKVLFICTVNNKSLFDRMMGSDGSEAGALSSRCVTQIYYPRPTEMILHQILIKEIREKGGREEWIAPAIQMAKELGATDPRIVRSYLAGGDRLLDKSYQRDWIAVYEARKSFNK
jgi:energy-coupling factor transporter ATP-binding protein EcfA2